MTSIDNPTISEVRRRNLLRLMTERYNGRQAPLARDIERKPDYVWRIVNNQKGFGEDLARKIEEILKLPPGWFDDASNSTANGSIPQAADKVVIVTPLDPEPLLGGGIPIRMATLAVARGNVDSVRSIVIDDPAMSLTFEPNDHAIVDTAQTVPSLGELYAVKIGGAVKVRRIFPSKDESWVLRCDTHDKLRYDDMTIESSDLTIIGRVIWSAGKR